VPDNEQGELQGSLTSLNSVAAIIGPILMTTLFYKFTEKEAAIYFPGAPFMAAAILSLISLLLIVKTLKKNAQ
jgi:DHA1 family tetracycline resistance protein-like MFS transporter